MFEDSSQWQSMCTLYVDLKADFLHAKGPGTSPEINYLIKEIYQNTGRKGKISIYPIHWLALIMTQDIKKTPNLKYSTFPRFSCR